VLDGLRLRGRPGDKGWRRAGGENRDVLEGKKVPSLFDVCVEEERLSLGRGGKEVGSRGGPAGEEHGGWKTASWGVGG